MKIPKAALIAVLGATTTAAFTPSHMFGGQSTALRSTTVKNEDIFQDTDRNGAVEKDIIELMSKPQEPAKKGPPAVSKAVLEAQASRKTRAAVSGMMKQYENQSGAAIVYSKLLEHGVEVVNGYSGGAVLPLLDQFHLENPRHKDAGYTPIRWITNSNESSAGHIAE